MKPTDKTEPVARMTDAEAVKTVLVALAAKTEGESRALVEVLSFRLGFGHVAAIAEAHQRDAERIANAEAGEAAQARDAREWQARAVALAEARQGDTQRNLAIIHKANPEDKYETVQEGIEAIISERNQALKNDEAGEARIAELEKEIQCLSSAERVVLCSSATKSALDNVLIAADQSHGVLGNALEQAANEFAAVIERAEAAEARASSLSVTLGQVRETLLAHEWVEASYTDRPPIRFCLGCSAIADGFYNETPLPNHEPDCWLAATLNTLSPVPPPTPTVGKLD